MKYSDKSSPSPSLVNNTHKHISVLEISVFTSINEMPEKNLGMYHLRISNQSETLGRDSMEMWDYTKQTHNKN